jgi:hypothetical protein
MEQRALLKFVLKKMRDSDISSAPCRKQPAFVLIGGF